MRIPLLLLCLAATVSAAPFEIKDGDRVLLLGDALLERENGFGHLETRMHEQFPAVRFSVRNLSWSGETPRGWSRASFDKPEKGHERLNEQIAAVKPTVAILGFGMAASLQEMTDRSGDIALNRDPARYGAEPMSAARFKKELGELMDAIGKDTRFILLSPIPHEDLRASRPGLPDPAPHNALLAQYTRAIEELARERGAVFCNAAPSASPSTHNGIALTDPGYASWVVEIGKKLQWTATSEKWRQQTLHWPVIRKNELFFHQTRPANSTYLFGFRKHEQGKNAAEIPQFDPLIAAADAETDKLKRMTKAEVIKKSGMPPFDGPWNNQKDVVLPVAKDANTGPKKDELILEMAPGPKFRIETFETADFGVLAKELTARSAADKKVILRAGKSLKYEEVKKVLMALGELNVKNVIFSAVDPNAKDNANAKPTLPLPAFTTTEGMEMTLWADTPLVGKPVGMNWDAAGRLWVACSPVYPMIKPGGHPEDKIVVLEDTDRDGKADKTTTFASGLVIAAGVAPDLVKDAETRRGGDAESPQATPAGKISASPRPRVSVSAAYVGASTELLHLTDTDGDGKADTRRTVLGGFGTEDTHHTIHTLRWGPDGRLYFNQSIYIHSHIETPWGMVRANSGAIMAYDPRTERTEVHAKGWCNPWGHAWDEWGQEFVTDGAGGQGISWLVPGAMYFTYENAPRIMPSISPGGYPKYCGLELVRSPIFPPEWQGNAITCDFRAHRIVRFQMNDLGPEKSGYVTKEMPAPVTTTDATFRPIDVKHGPDGALYFADWTNPIINHGEVDFRDPRRDHVNGRIWRLAPKGKAGKWESLVGKKLEDLLDGTLSKSAWEKEQSRIVTKQRASGIAFSHAFIYQNYDAALDAKQSGKPELEAQFATFRAIRDWRETSKVPRVYEAPEDVLLEKAWLYARIGCFDAAAWHSFPLIGARDPRVRAGWIRLISDRISASPEEGREHLASFAKVLKQVGVPMDELKTGSGANGYFFLRMQAQMAARDKDPRVRVEAMRALAKIPMTIAAGYLLEAAVNVPGAKDAVAALPDAPKQQFASSSASESADTHYAYAAWLSVSDLAPQVAEWVETAATAQEAPKHRDAMISYALQTLPSAQAGPLLTKIIAKNGVPKDGSGPWIEIIGQSGGPAECRILLDALFAATTPDSDLPKPLAEPALRFTTPAAEQRAAAALVAAARRGVKPAGPRGGWQFFHYAPAAPEVVLLAGLWKEDGVADSLAARMDADASPALRDAVFESLRTLGSDEAAKTLTAFLDPQRDAATHSAFLKIALRRNDAALRRRALGALAAFRPDAALASLNAVLAEAEEPGLLPLWRELFASEPFAKKFASAVPKDAPKPALTAALKAARELGKKGDKLTSALTPLIGEMPAAAPQDFAALVEMTKKNGNPVEGETLYRRAALACTVCHAIGGAGGKVGPDMTTLGASAPLDYIIESTMAPAVKVKEGYHAISLALKGGRSATGVIARESDKDILLRDATGAESTVAKADIQKREDIGSLMPAGLLAQLSQREQTHVFAFLAALGKPGPFDATRATVARTWEIFPGKDVEAIVAGKPAKPGAKVLTMVDGRLLKTQIAEALPMIPEAGDTIIAVARFNGSGKTRLNLTGVTKAWLDGAPLAIASEPKPEVELSNGDHTLAVKLDAKDLPELLRAGCDDVRFLNE